MNNRVLFPIVAIMAVACFAIVTQSETISTTPDGMIDLPNTPIPIDLVDLNSRPANPADWRIVATGPDLAGGAYLDCPRYGQGCYDCSCVSGGYGVFGNRARPFWCRGPVRRLISFPFRCRR